MKLVDMKLDKEEKKKQNQPIKEEGPGYPYELRITLGEKILKKLSLVPKDFHGKKTVEINAIADIGVIKEIINKKDSWEGNSVELQITKLGLAGMSEKKPGKFEEHQKQVEKGPGE